MLVIAGGDHHRIQFLVRQHFLGVLKHLGPGAEYPLRVVGGAFAVHRPEIADAAHIEIRIRLGGQLQHRAMAGSPVAAADLADLNAIVGAHNPGVGARRLRQSSRGPDKPPVASE